MNAWEYLRNLNEVCYFMSREREGKATNSELKRWLQNQSVQLNGRRIKWDESVAFPVEQLILHPKRNKTTLF